MTALNHTWHALFRPGEADDFFDFTAPAFEPAAGSFSLVNALWLAELSRLVYNCAPSRPGVLEQAGFTEVASLSHHSLQALLVSPTTTGSESCSILVFRGTHDLRNWISNITIAHAPWPPGGIVHKGFKDALDTVWREIESWLDRYPTPRAFYAGHSLGGALATLAASRRPTKAVYTFGAPRVGDAAFCATLHKTAVHRIVNGQDIVPGLPLQHNVIDFQHPEDEPALHLRHTDLEMPFIEPPLSVENVLWRHLQPPPALADHAPVNYVARLQAANTGTSDNESLGH